MKRRVHNPITSEVEGIKEPRYIGIFTPESEQKMKAKLGKWMSIGDTDKYKHASPALQKRMRAAAHARRIRTLSLMYDQDE